MLLNFFRQIKIYIDEVMTLPSDSFDYSATMKGNDYKTAVCRICYGSSEEEELKTPCKCLGSVKHIHQSCLMNWLRTSYKHCEICNTPYRFYKTLLPYNKVSKLCLIIVFINSFILQFSTFTNLQFKLVNH